MEWTKVKLFTTTEAIEIVSGYIISNGLRGIVIEDAKDFNDFLEDTSVYWDYIDDELMKLTECETSIAFYIPDNIQGREMFGAIKSGIGKLRLDNPDVDMGRLEFEIESVNEQDWSTAWKKYYHPTRIGEKIVVCPCWETCDLKDGDVKVTLDPGMAFGTGTHETTSLCMALIEENLKKGDTVLDIGTGSGILSITSLLLGAKSAVGVDIDELAVKIAHENAELNGVSDKAEFVCGDLTEKISSKFDLICANIVADVIIRLCDSVTNYMHKNTTFIVSGIINDRCDDVLGALQNAGLKITQKKELNDWVAVCCKLENN